MTQLALIVVLVVDVTVQVTLPPDTVIRVAPFRPMPVNVTGTVVPCVPVAGATEARLGPCTVKLVVADPPGVVTVTVLFVMGEVAVIVRFAVMLVEEATATEPTVTLPPLIATVVPVVVKLLPVMVTGTVVPRTPVLGVIDDTVGAGGATTVNVRLGLVAPPAFVTLRFLAVAAAPSVIARLAVTVVSFTTVMPLAVTPEPDTVIAVTPVRLLPVKVTGTLVPA
jgi:hypothetical protein